MFVINTTLCGDLGDPTYGPAGCPGTCAEQVADPANFDGIFDLDQFLVLVLTFCVPPEAHWDINYLKVFQPA